MNSLQEVILKRMDEIEKQIAPLEAEYKELAKALGVEPVQKKHYTRRLVLVKRTERVPERQQFVRFKANKLKSLQHFFKEAL